MTQLEYDPDQSKVTILSEDPQEIELIRELYRMLDGVLPVELDYKVTNGSNSISVGIKEGFEEPKFYIWSNEHNGWWAPNRKGYVEDKREAEVYGYTQAKEICRQANIAKEDHEVPDEALVPV